MTHTPGPPFENLKLQPLINCFLLLLTGLGTMGQNRRLTCLFFKFNGIKCETAWPPFATNCLVGFIVVLINCPVVVVYIQSCTMLYGSSQKVRNISW